MVLKMNSECDTEYDSSLHDLPLELKSFSVGIGIRTTDSVFTLLIRLIPIFTVLNTTKMVNLFWGGVCYSKPMKSPLYKLPLLVKSIGIGIINPVSVFTW